MARKITQSNLILRSLDSKLVSGLYELSKNTEIMESLKQVMQIIQNVDTKHIVDNAGGVNSMDNLVNAAVDSSFYRGGISRIALLYTLIVNAEKEIEKREAKK